MLKALSQFIMLTSSIQNSIIIDVMKQEVPYTDEAAGYAVLIPNVLPVMLQI
jgi:hypothetical protein